MIIYGGLGRLLEKHGFQILKGLVLFEKKKLVELYILSSSSSILYIDNEKFLLDIFPCDIKDPYSLPLKVKRVILDSLDGILKKEQRGETFGVSFWIKRPNRNNNFLEVKENRKTVGYAGIFSNFGVYYSGITLETSERPLLSKSYEEISKGVREVLGNNILELRESFGEDLGYSAIFFKENNNKFLFLTIHTWPESRIAHIEIISDVEIESENLLKNIFKGEYRILSKYEKR